MQTKDRNIRIFVDDIGFRSTSALVSRDSSAKVWDPG